MQYREYGKTGLKVSALGLGCMRLPRIVTPEKTVVDTEKAFELIRYAVQHGVNYFDTAFTYHGGNSESVLGEALDGGLREKVHIVTKQPSGAMTDVGAIRRNLETALKRLRTDYIDVYLLHNINAGSWDTFEKMQAYREYEKFRAEGLIRHIGFSYHGGLPLFKEVLARYPWEMCQIQMNLLDVDKEATEEAITLAGEKGAALAIMEPLRGGGLAGGPASVRAMYDAQPTQRTPAEWAFRFLLNYPQVSTILSGMSTLEQLKENIATFSAPDAVPGCLSAAERDLLMQVKRAYEAIVTIPCTGCEYCLPCPQNVRIPGVFGLYNSGMMFENFEPSQRGYMFATKAGQDASKCVACGACEAQCPQSIGIIEALRTAHDALKGWTE